MRNDVIPKKEVKDPSRSSGWILYLDLYLSLLKD